VQGAPAIAIVGCLSLAVELNKTEFDSAEILKTFVKDKLDYLVTARPTAVNMAEAAGRFKSIVTTVFDDNNLLEGKENIIVLLEAMLEEDIATNRKMGEHGARV